VYATQQYSNMLWSLATMKLLLGDRAMGLLERGVEDLSGEFKSQNVANTLWAFATMQVLRYRAL
jgi:hypothetical protein